VLLLGTAGYPSPQVLQDAIVASGTEVVTVGLKRTLAAGGDNGFVAAIARTLRERGGRLLPNTAGCRSARGRQTPPSFRPCPSCRTSCMRKASCC